MKKMQLLLILSLFGCSAKVQQSLKNDNQVKTEQFSITFDAAKKASQTAAEVFDIGTVPVNGTIQKTFTISNLTSANIALNFADLQNQISANDRFAINFATATPCGSTIKLNKTCSFIISLKYNSTGIQDYSQPIITNIVDATSQGGNTEFGKILISGSKEQDISIQVAPSGILKLSTLTESFTIPENGSQTKRFYLGNIGSGLLKTPTINAPAGGSIINNLCATVATLKPNGSCYFEIKYDYLAGGSSNPQITFTSNDQLVNTNGVSIQLAVTMQPLIIPNISANFSQIGYIADLTNPSLSTRLYMTNNSAMTENPLTLIIPAPYIIKATSCTTILKIGKSCFYDLGIDPIAAANMNGVSTQISFGSGSASVSSGIVSAPGSNNCKPGFTLDSLNNCITTKVTPIYYTMLPNVNGLISSPTNSDGSINQLWADIFADGSLVQQSDIFGNVQLDNGLVYTSKGVLIPNGALVSASGNSKIQFSNNTYFDSNKLYNNSGLVLSTFFKSYPNNKIVLTGTGFTAFDGLILEDGSYYMLQMAITGNIYSINHNIDNTITVVAQNNPAVGCGNCSPMDLYVIDPSHYSSTDYLNGNVKKVDWESIVNNNTNDQSFLNTKVSPASGYSDCVYTNPSDYNNSLGSGNIMSDGTITVLRSVYFTANCQTYQNQKNTALPIRTSVFYTVALHKDGTISVLDEYSGNWSSSSANVGQTLRSLDLNGNPTTDSKTFLSDFSAYYNYNFTIKTPISSILRPGIQLYPVGMTNSIGYGSLWYAIVEYSNVTTFYGFYNVKTNEIVQATDVGLWRQYDQNRCFELLPSTGSLYKLTIGSADKTLIFQDSSLLDVGFGYSSIYLYNNSYGIIKLINYDGTDIPGFQQAILNGETFQQTLFSFDTTTGTPRESGYVFLDQSGNYKLYDNQFLTSIPLGADLYQQIIDGGSFVSDYIDPIVGDLFSKTFNQFFYNY